MNWAIVILLSNYFHDLAVAMLFSAMLCGWLLERRLSEGGLLSGPIAREIHRVSRHVAVGALVWIVLGGIIRTVTYRQFEWSEAAGRGQVTALVVKHVVLVGITLLGLIWLIRGRES